MWICMDCGSTDKFTKIITWKEIATEVAVCDSTEEEVDYIDHETEDSERIDEGEYCCERCKSHNLQLGLNKEDVEEEQMFHTRKDGSWSKDDLPEKERNQKLKERILAGRL